MQDESIQILCKPYLVWHVAATCAFLCSARVCDFFKFYLQMSLLSYICAVTSSSHFACSYTDTRELSTATAEEVEYEGDGTVAADGFAADYVTPEGNFESFAAYTVKNTTNATDAGRTTTNPV